MLSIYKRGKLGIKRKEKKNSFFLSIGGRLLQEKEGEMISKFLNFFLLKLIGLHHKSKEKA
jgi:hypothetical protein